MNQTILLTFLGAGRYEPCHYELGEVIDENQETYFSVSLARVLKPDQVFSLQTDSASEKHGESLDFDLKNLGCSHTKIPIPNGKSEGELWKIFSILTEHIPQNCTLHLDITHGFRSLPLIGFLALSYLRVTRNITIGGIHYGAWEARKIVDGKEAAPVFDLTPFLSLQDWTSAVEQFQSTGSADQLAEQLKKTQSSLQKAYWQKKKTDGEIEPLSEPPKILSSLGSALTDSSNGLLLLRVKDLEQSAKKVNDWSDQAQQEVESYAAPFLEVLKPVREELTHFNNTDLKTLRELVEWLVGKGQVAASLTLANEWIVSLVMVYCAELHHASDGKARESYSGAVAVMEQKECEREVAKEVAEVIQKIRVAMCNEELVKLLKISSRIRDARNDINHSGLNTNPLKVQKLKARAKEVAKELGGLKLPDFESRS